MAGAKERSKSSRRADPAALDRLVAEAQSGDREALRALQSHLAKILSGRSAGGRPSPGIDPAIGHSDLVQETVLRVGDRFPQFRGASFAELVGWTRAILRNSLLERARKYKTHNSPELLEKIWDSLRARRERSSSAVATEEDEARAGQQLALLDAALDGLSQPERAMIVLRVCEGLDWASIGRYAGRSDDAVRKVVERALARLRKWMADHDAC